MSGKDITNNISHLEGFPPDVSEWVNKYLIRYSILSFVSLECVSEWVNTSNGILYFVPFESLLSPGWLSEWLGMCPNLGHVSELRACVRT